MYYWRFRRSLLTPGFGREVNEHQRLCTSVWGLFSFLTLGTAAGNSYWFFVYCLNSTNVVNSSNLFQANPQAYICWLYFLSGKQPRIHRNYFSVFRVSAFRRNEVIRVKEKTRQAMYFQATIDAQVRHQYRNASAYRRRIF